MWNRSTDQDRKKKREIGEKIRALRLKKRRASLNPNEWNQDALAERLGVVRTTVQNWEIGRAAPTPENAKRLAEMLGVEERELRVRDL